MFHECRHIKDDGLRCRAAALQGKPYCYFHMKLKRMHSQALIQIPPIEDSTSVLLAIGQVMRALNYETMDTKRAGLMLYGLQIASSVIKQREQARPEDYVRSVHNVEGDAVDFSEALIQNTPALAPESTVCEPPHDCASCYQKAACEKHQAALDTTKQPNKSDPSKHPQNHPEVTRELPPGNLKEIAATSHQRQGERARPLPESPHELFAIQAVADVVERSGKSAIQSRQCSSQPFTKARLCNNGTASAGPTTVYRPRASVAELTAKS